MEKMNHSITAILFFLLISFYSCENEDDSLPITNDFRLLQVRINNEIIDNESEKIPISSSLNLIFSHSLSSEVFENSFQISPNIEYLINYRESNSIAVIDFPDALEYNTTYQLSLPQGQYGENNEVSKEDFHYKFTTAEYISPSINLSTTTTTFFEGEKTLVDVVLNRAVTRTVEVKLAFSGSAELSKDFLVSDTQLVFEPGETSKQIELSAIVDEAVEGEELIDIKVESSNNAVVGRNGQLQLTLGDQEPSLILKGILSLKIDGNSSNGRAIHLRATDEISDLSQYGIGIANNGGGTDGREINLPASSVQRGDDILVLRDIDDGNLQSYFGNCLEEFELSILSEGVNFNGDDAVELYNGTIVIETYGDVEIDGTGMEWEFTGSWAYKVRNSWDYGPIDCASNVPTNNESNCSYPICNELQLQGALALLWNGSGTNGGKAVQLRANRDISDLSRYGLGVANNGGGSDGEEINFPSISVDEGEHILVAREPSSIASYFGICFENFAEVIQSDGMNQNGDDAIELFKDGNVIETYGDVNVDGTGQVWEYSGSWAYKLGGVWNYGGVDCADQSSTTQTSDCPYVFCN